MRSFFFSKAALVVFSTLLTLLLAGGAYEIYARNEYRAWRENFAKDAWINTVTTPSKTPGMLWEYRPNVRLGYMVFNRFGFRDRDYPGYDKPQGNYRIAFAGDSVTLALLIQDINLGFVRRYESGINATRPAKMVQAMNFSVDGYNTPQVTAMVRAKALPFHPDKVVYVMCLNDFDFDDSSGLKILFFNPPRSFLFNKLEKAYINWMKIDFHLYYFNQNKEAVFDSIEEMKTDVEAAGAEFEMAILPVFPMAPPYFRAYQLYEVHEKIHKRLGAMGIRYTDLLDRFQHAKEPPAYFALDLWHPTIAGHQAIADVLIKHIGITPQISKAH